MLAIQPYAPGMPPEPVLVERPDPEPTVGEVLLEVEATALNRADLLQLRGRYPPPSGESEIPGLEAAGRVIGVGPGVTEVRVGERYAALLAGGGHAERVAVPTGQLIPIPAGWTSEEAGSLPEAALTAWTNLVAEGTLLAGERVLIAGATSGVGSFAVQLARELGGEVVAAGRDGDRLARLGVERTVVLGPHLGPRVRELTGGRGADLVIDFVGGEHLPELLEALAPRGRLILVGLTAGSRATIDLGRLLRDRLRVVGSVLRSRPRSEKAELVRAFRAFGSERLAARTMVPVIDRIFPFSEVRAAYEHLAHGRPLGKVALRLS